MMTGLSILFILLSSQNQTLSCCTGDTPETGDTYLVVGTAPDRTARDYCIGLAPVDDTKYTWIGPPIPQSVECARTAAYAASIAMRASVAPWLADTAARPVRTGSVAARMT